MALQRQDVPWSYEDLRALPDDGKRYEIIEGELFELTGPNLFHATAVSNLVVLLLPFVQALGGRLYPAVFDLFLPGAEPVEPDIAILLPSNPARKTVRGIEGPPDIVIEVLSPSNRTHDLLTKRAIYQRGGVREYWIADPEGRTLEVVSFVGGTYRSRTLVGDDVVASDVLPGVAFPASAVFAGMDGIE